MKTINPTVAHLRMLASFRGQIWSIRPELAEEFAFSALEVPERSGTSDVSDFYNLRQPMSVDADGIAHIWIVGALMNKAPAIYEKLGLATRYATIIAETQSAVSSGAKAILYHVDSPGGTVAGVVEAGEAIASAGIPTAAHCHGLACSAAYWLASGTGAIFANPSAEIGNIGAIISWADCSEFWEGMGVKFKALVSEGADLKSTFHTEPDEAQIAFLQEAINEAGKAFREHVAAGRGAAGANLNDEVWRAGWYSGNRAANLGLADEITSAENARAELLAIVSELAGK
jgi:ClpP class serine protease